MAEPGSAGADCAPDPEAGVALQRPAAMRPPQQVQTALGPLGGLQNETVSVFGYNIPVTVLFPVLGFLALLAFGLKGIVLVGGAGALVLLCRSSGTRESGSARSAPRPSGPRIRTLRDLPQAPSGGG